MRSFAMQQPCLRKMEREFLPSCWEDDERMNYLFSAFRENRQSNQNDWDTKMTFWTKCIEQYYKCSKTAVFQSDQISNNFQRNGVIPMGMETVMKEMLRTGKIIQKEDFERNVDGGWIGWGADVMVRRPARWAINSVLKGNQRIPQGTYIHKNVLEDMTERVLSRHYSSPSPDSITSHIQEQSDFESSIADICSDEETKSLIILELRRRKKVVVNTLMDGCKVVKFASSKTTAVDPLTETEIGVFRLQKTVASLSQQLERLTREVQNHQQQARLHIQKGLKTSAKNSLRKKKLTEQRLEKREGTLNILQELLEKIQSAKTDKMIIDAYKAGSSALKGTLKENNLTPEAVDDTLSEVQEVMEMCNEINDTLAQGNKDLDESMNLDLDLEESTLEAELDALMNPPADQNVEEEATTDKEKGKGDVLSDLPPVPNSLPKEEKELPQRELTAS